MPQCKITIAYWPEKESLNHIAIPYIQLTIPFANNIEDNYVILGKEIGNLNENETAKEQNYKFA